MSTRKELAPLTPAVFYILLALYGKDRHGYDIMGQVNEDSEGKVTMGPGTLYGSLDRMMESGFVERSALRSDDSRRIYYRLSAKGQTVLQAEVDRLLLATKIAASRQLKTI